MSRPISIKSKNPHIEKVSDYFRGRTGLAKFCDVTDATVNGWIKRGKIPARHAFKLEARTGVKAKDLLAYESTVKPELESTSDFELEDEDF